MNILIIILVIISIIIFIPIPFSVRLRYIDKVEIYIYGFKLNIVKIQNMIKKRRAKKDNCSEEEKDEEKSAKLNYYKKIISNISNLRFKPSIRLRLKSHYGLNDAAVTAISYGLISSVFAVIYQVLNKFFNIKEYNLSVNPEYNKLIFDCDAKCIIFISLAKIIYMGIIFLKSIKKSKELAYSFT